MRGRRRAALVGLCAIVAVALCVTPAATALGSRPYPSSGVISIATHRATPAEVYVIVEDPWTQGRALLRSENYGASWATVPGLPQDLSGVEVGPDGRVFVADARKGVYASDDRGKTWAHLLGPTGGEAWRVGHIAVASRDAQALCVSVGWRVGLSTSRYLVFSSRDGGVSWKRTDFGARTDTFIGLAGFPVAASPDGREALASAPEGLYRSTDFGRSWWVLDTPQYGRPVYQCYVSYDPADPTIAYALENAYTSHTPRLFRSVDGGATWNLRYTPPGGDNPPGTPEDGFWIGWCPEGFTVSDQGNVYLSARAFDSDLMKFHSWYRVELSTDGGATFSSVADPWDPGPTAGSWDWARLTIDIDSRELSLYLAGEDSGFERVWLGDSTLLYGRDRYETAVEVSRALYPDDGTAGGVVVTTARNFPDAMAAGPLAHAVDGPILLADPVTGMPSWVADEAERACGADATAYLIGGTDVVPASVETDLEARGFAVVRIAGRTRYETAVEVAEELENPTRVVIATGEDFPDALAASAPAAKMGAPVLFSFGERLRPAVRDYLEDRPDISRAYVIGGDDVVSAAVEDELEDLVGETVRLAGTTRYDTSRAVADRFWGNGSDFAAIASGADFPDALSGAVLAAQQDGPLLIATPDDLSWPTSDWLSDHDPDDVFFIGGPDVVSGAPAYEYEALR